MFQRQKRNIIKEEESDKSPRSDSLGNQYEVEKIIKKKVSHGKTLYFIKWVGYPSEQNTWEPLDHLTSIKSMVDQFESKQKKLFEKPKKVLPHKESQFQERSEIQRKKKIHKNISDKEIKKNKEEKKKSDQLLNFDKVDQDSQIEKFQFKQKQQQSKIQQKYPLRIQITNLPLSIQKQVNQKSITHSEKVDQKLNKSYSFNQQSGNSLSFIIDEAQTQKSYKYSRPVMNNIKDLTTLMTQAKNTILQKKIQDSEQLLKKTGIILFEIPRVFCEVKLLNTNTNQIFDQCLIPFENILLSAPRLLDMKMGQYRNLLSK